MSFITKKNEKKLQQKTDWKIFKKAFLLSQLPTKRWGNNINSFSPVFFGLIGKIFWNEEFPFFLCELRENK